jgi:hypothetical protein
MLVFAVTEELNLHTMRRITQPLSAIAAALLLTLLVAVRSLVVAADQANVPSLIISQLKITGSSGQFITLYNATDTTLDMSKYQLEYFNSYDLAKATSSKLIALTGTVPPHGYFMVNDSALLLCYQLTIDSVSLGLSSTAGLVEVLAFNQSSPGSSVVPVLQDYVGWSKTPAGGAQGLPSNTNAFLQRQPVDSKNNPAVAVPGTGSWQPVQPNASNQCGLVTATGAPTDVLTGLGQLLPAVEAPATIISVLADSGTAPAVIPAADIGLTSPSVTELLPNPVGTGNDSTDEFIELYNPNPAAFDLSGFVLQTGLSSFRKYTFPSGTSLQPQKFTAFYSKNTGLSLSNTSSQVKLIDPLGNSLSASEVYGTAKDGLAWAQAKGKWYWTASLTPGAANVIKAPTTTKAGSKAAAKKPATGSAAAKTALSSGSADEPSIIPIHTKTLALIVGLALLYGAYEYRADFKNRFYQLRRYLGARQADRQPAEGRRSD